MDDTQSSSPVTDELRADAGRAAEAATDRLTAEADDRKGAVADQAQKLSSALGSAARELGSDGPNWLTSALEQGARTIEDLARTVDQRESRELVGEVERFARERPGTFLAGCAAAGFVAARVFKAGASAASAAVDSGPGGTPGTSQGGAQNDHGSNGAPGGVQGYEPYDAQGGDAARPVMAFTDGGGAAAPVSPQSVGTSL